MNGAAAQRWGLLGGERTADHPGWVVLPLSAAAWLLLVAQPASGGIALCLDPAVGALGSVGDRLDAAWQTGALGRMLVGWVVMTMAMMLPLVAAMLRHVTARSFAIRRGRAAAEFVAGYLAVWTLVGVVLLPVAAAAPAPRLGGGVAPVAGFLLAAAWQYTAAKRRASLRCHRTVPLSPWGWRADRDCVAFGLAHGRACAASCWAMMLACALSSHALLAMLCVQAIVVAERGSRTPVPHRSALVLAGCGVLVAVLAVAH